MGGQVDAGESRMSPGRTNCYPRSSYQVAIGEAIERELEGRNGVRHDTKTAMENFPQVEGATRDIAAKAAGFGKTYEQAKHAAACGFQIRKIPTAGGKDFLKLRKTPNPSEALQ